MTRSCVPAHTDDPRGVEYRVGDRRLRLGRRLLASAVRWQGRFIDQDLIDPVGHIP
jgi:hypothetical protein